MKSRRTVHKTNTVIRIIFYFVVLILIAYFLVNLAIANQSYHEGALVDTKKYTFSSENILEQIKNGDSNIFSDESFISETSSYSQFKSNSYHWDQEDILLIAEEIHQFYWKESLDSWKIYLARYRIDQCKNITNGIDSAQFSFYKERNGNFTIHGIRIKPHDGVVVVGIDYISRPIGWEDFNSTSGKIPDLSTAFSLAEKNGGRTAQLLAKENCFVDASLSPYLPYFSLGKNMWSWHLIYQDSNLDIIFEISINPYTGKYKILN